MPIIENQKITEFVKSMSKSPEEQEKMSALIHNCINEQNTIIKLAMKTIMTHICTLDVTKENISFMSAQFIALPSIGTNIMLQLEDEFLMFMINAVNAQDESLIHQIRDLREAIDKLLIELEQKVVSGEMQKRMKDDFLNQKFRW
jgi:hypothetical protein